METIKITCKGAAILPLETLSDFQGEAKILTPDNEKKVRKAILKYGFSAPVFIWVNEGINNIIDGHQRIKTLRTMESEGYKIPDLPVAYIDARDEKEAKEKLLHITSQYGEFSQEGLLAFSMGLDLGEMNLRLTRKEFKITTPIKDWKLLTEFFIAPPFSILDTRKGYWQDRKTLWKSRILDEGETRKGARSMATTVRRGDEIMDVANGVSILDPVLAEIANMWFGISGGNTFDPFAGDAVFGYVSAMLGNHFTGIELREEQATANQNRVDREKLSARYIADDGQNVGKHIEPGSQDLMFSCPPYFDLEVYSDLKNDASNQPTYEAFLDILRTAFTAGINCLKENRFAVIVVGDVRDKKTGRYLLFPDEVKRMFTDAGAMLYNEMILIESGISAGLRAKRNMRTRKIVKMHQNVLVFYKGDPAAIKATFPEIRIQEDESTDI